MEMVLIAMPDLRAMISEAIREAMVLPEQPPPVVQEADHKLLTRKQVQLIFGVSLPTLIRWSKERILPCLHINRSVRYKQRDVNHLLQNRRGGITNK